MADDTGNVFEELDEERLRVLQERAKRDGQPVVDDEAKPVYKADAVDELEPVHGADELEEFEAVESPRTATLEQTVDEPENTLEETSEKVVEGLKGLGRRLGERYRKTTQAIRDADLPEKARTRVERIAEGVRDANLGEKARTTAGKLAERLGTVTESVKAGTEKNAERFRDAKDKVRGIANPEKQLATLQELMDLVLLYNPSTGTNPSLNTVAGVTSSVLVVGNTLEENRKLVNDLVSYVEGSAIELGYTMVRFNEFKDFENYTAEGDALAPECRIVRLNSSYFVKSNMRTNTNLLNLFRAATNPKGITLFLAEDIDLLYSQAGNRTEVLNSNARVTGLRRVVEQQAIEGRYKGNWLLVCTTADEDGLPDDVEKIVQLEL